MRKLLFVHQNFPSQFLHLATYLGGYAQVQVAAIGSMTSRDLPGVRLVRYDLNTASLSPAHPFAARFDSECRRAEQVLHAAKTLMESGFIPDIIFAHPGWGEALPLRSLFPKSRIVAYCEFYYLRDGQDRGFDPEFPQEDIDGRVGVHLRNASTLLALDDCDVGIAPTRWQKLTFPQEYRQKIEVIHDGVDTDQLRPDDDAYFLLPSGHKVTRDDEILTYATRSHEPLRGYHVFMRALPKILEARANAQILIIGGRGTGYGIDPPSGQKWRDVYLDEISSCVDRSRLHFLGHLPYADYVRALQVSRAHIYLTYPFVLSWSLIEAMSVGCLPIVSNTAPVWEVIDGTNGILVEFFDIDELSKQVIDALASPTRFQEMRERARATAVDRYDLKRVCLPALLKKMGISPS